MRGNGENHQMVIREQRERWNWKGEKRRSDWVWLEHWLRVSVEKSDYFEQSDYSRFPTTAHHMCPWSGLPLQHSHAFDRWVLRILPSLLSCEWECTRYSCTRWTLLLPHSILWQAPLESLVKSFRDCSRRNSWNQGMWYHFLESVPLGMMSLKEAVRCFITLACVHWMVRTMRFASL